MSIISLQDEYKSDGKNWGVGLNVSGKIPGTEKTGGYARPTGSVNYGENHQDSKWTGNQTSILAENGGNIKVGETLTNVGSIIGSLSNDNKLSIEANKVVVENLKDYNEGSNFGLSMGGIGLGTKDQGNTTPIGQTGVQYGSHEKAQDTNATFVNAEVTEAGKKLNLEEMGINTDINKAQVVTKDEVVEQIDTVLHTDLLNETTRNQVIRDINGLIQTPGDIIKAISETNKNGGNVLDNLVGTIRNTDGNLIKYQEMDKKYKDLKNLPDEEKAEKALELANEMARKLKENNGIDEKVEIKISFADESKGEELGAFVREDGKIEIYINPSKVDVSDMEQVYNALGAEMNHYNPSNPYVYDKTEAEARKGNALEELFTSIGRKALNGEGNEFYENILSGSSVLNSGNKDYLEIPEELLDFCSNPIQCPGYKFDHNKKQSVKVEEKGSSMTVGVGLTLEQIAKNIANNLKQDTKKNETKEKTRKLTEEYKAKYSGVSKNIIAIDANEVAKNPDKKAKIESRLEFENKWSLIDYRVVEDPTQWGPWLAMAGQGLAQTGDPKLAGLGILIQGAGGVINVAKGSSELAKGNKEEGIQYIGLGILSLGGAYMQQQASKPGLSQTTTSNKGVTPEKYYEFKNKVGMTPEVAEVVNKNYGTNYVPVITQETTSKGVPLNLQLFAEKKNESVGYSGGLIKVNKPDKGADELAKRIGGESRVKFSNDPKGREFDSVSDKYIAQAKPDLNGYGQSWRNQTKATFEAAQETGKIAYFQFEGIPNESIIRKIEEYGKRYGVKYIIDTKPLGIK